MNKIKKHFYNLSNQKQITKRIVLLADIHFYNKKDYIKLEKVFKEVKILYPDYICLAGDLVDNAYITDQDIIYNWIKKLSTITTVIISIGNHDLLVKEKFESGFDKKLFDKFNKLKDVIVLDNKDIVLDNICFKGITFPASYYYQVFEPEDLLVEYLNDTFPKINKETYNVLLCHTPLTICKKGVIDKINIGNNLDLILCGHTHGGITPEFLKPLLHNVGLISPFRKLFFKNAYGHVKLNNTDVIITSGITKASHRNKFHILDRFFAREITVIDIKSK